MIHNNQPMSIRLAFREEGKWWNAYLAPMGSMVGATRVGSVRMNIVRSDSAAKEAFMAAKKVALATTIKGVIGVEPTEWETRQAPESERSGNA